MALVKQPLGGIAASGTLGGMTFARNRAGQYARAWAKPVNPGTARQSFVRGQFAAASVGWGMLTQVEVDAWNAYGQLLTRLNKLGEPYTPKGRQVYMEVNSNLAQALTAPISVPSAITDNPAMTGTTIGAITETAGVLDGAVITQIKYDIPSSGDGVALIEATPPVDPKVTNTNNLFRQIMTQVGPSPIAATDIEAAYIAVFGSAALAGQVIDIRVRVVDEVSGLGSSYIVGRQVIT